MQYITDIENLKENIPFKARFNDQDIVIYKTSKSIYALEDMCSHENFALSQSTSEDDSVECKLHGSKFDLATGSPLSLPALRKVKTYQIKVENSKVYVFE